MRNRFVATLCEAAARDPSIWLVCGDVGFSVVEPFLGRFSDRYLNAGVAEQNMIGVAAGLALSGKTVFVYSIGNFPTLRCIEQIRNDVCVHRASVKVVALGAGFTYAPAGYSHYAIEDVAIMASLPGMEVFVPADPAEVQAVTADIAGSGGPAYLRLARAGEPMLGESEIACARTPRLLRPGDEVAILTNGPIALTTIAVRDRLAEAGISAAVISVPCVRPWPTDAVMGLIGGARLVVTVEEHRLHGGLFHSVAGTLASRDVHPPVLGLGIENGLVESAVAGKREHLLQAVGLDAETITRRIMERVRHAPRAA